MSGWIKRMTWENTCNFRRKEKGCLPNCRPSAMLRSTGFVPRHHRFAQPLVLLRVHSLLYGCSSRHRRTSGPYPYSCSNVGKPRLARRCPRPALLHRASRHGISLIERNSLTRRRDGRGLYAPLRCAATLFVRHGGHACMAAHRHRTLGAIITQICFGVRSSKRSSKSSMGRFLTPTRTPIASSSPSAPSICHSRRCRLSPPQ